MKKFRKWLIDRFLPRWAYESLLDELAAANKKQEELRQTVERQQCYISGLEYALRHMTPTVSYTHLLKVLGHTELIKTTETLDREALKRQPGDILQQVGAYIRTVDEFYYDVSSKEADA